MDVNEELKLCCKCRKKKVEDGGSGWRGVRMDVNEELKLLWKCKKSLRVPGPVRGVGRGGVGVGRGGGGGVGW